MIEQIPLKNVLRLELDAGVVDGKQRIIARNFTAKTLDMTDEEIYTAGTSIGQLQKRDLLTVNRVDTIKITQY